MLSRPLGVHNRLFRILWQKRNPMESTHSNKTKKTHGFYWIISPTYKLAEHRKNKILSSPDGSKDLTKTITQYNKYYLVATLMLAPYVDIFFDQALYRDDQYKYVNYIWVLSFGWVVYFSCAFEIFKAFLDDATDKLNHRVSDSQLSYGDRLRLAFNSYIELLVGFGTLYYMLPSNLFKGGSPGFLFKNVFEAVYFSGITMATVGYGDISPAHWLTQGLVLFQVFCGLTLALVSFTVYTSLALDETHKNRG